MIAALVALAAALLLAFVCAAGVFLGTCIYAHLYELFLHETEARFAKRLAAKNAEVAARERKIREALDYMRKTYGNDLSARHQEPVDEEIEKILSKGPNA